MCKLDTTSPTSIPSRPPSLFPTVALSNIRSSLPSFKSSNISNINSSISCSIIPTHSLSKSPSKVSSESPSGSLSLSPTVALSYILTSFLTFKSSNMSNKDLTLSPTMFQTNPQSDISS